MLTRKHFIAYANLIAEAEDIPNIIHLTANYFETENPRFNRKKWLEYVVDKRARNGHP